MTKSIPPPMPDYSPMETAPRDGSEIVLRTRIGEVSARYHPGDGWVETLDGSEYDGPAWVCYDDAFQLEIEETPIGELCEAVGWRPLPTFVESEAQAGLGLYTEFPENMSMGICREGVVREAPAFENCPEVARTPEPEERASAAPMPGMETTARDRADVLKRCSDACDDQKDEFDCAWMCSMLRDLDRALAENARLTAALNVDRASREAEAARVARVPEDREKLIATRDTLIALLRSSMPGGVETFWAAADMLEADLAEIARLTAALAEAEGRVLEYQDIVEASPAVQRAMGLYYDKVREVREARVREEERREIEHYVVEADMPAETRRHLRQRIRARARSQS